MKHVYRVRDNYGNIGQTIFTTPAKAIKYVKEQNAKLDPDDCDSHDYTIELQY